MAGPKFTSQLHEALARAQSLAVGKKNPAIEPVHVMKALLEQPNSSTAQPAISKLVCHWGKHDGRRLYHRRELYIAINQFEQRIKGSIRYEVLLKCNSQLPRWYPHCRCSIRCRVSGKS